MRHLAFHQLKGAVGVGDMHPGGVEATELLLEWIATRAHDGFRVLEVGAGIGNTSRRMVERGWAVTALEPDPVLFQRLRTRPGLRAVNQSLFEHHVEEPYDAVLAESVLYMNDLDEVFGRSREILRPEGLLAFVDAVWTDVVSGDEAAEIHDRSDRLFGIPVASRARLTWDDWRRALDAVGFETLESVRLEPASLPESTRRTLGPAARALLKNPLVLPQALVYHHRMRRFRLPQGALEGWAYLGQKGESPAGDGSFCRAPHSHV